MVKSNETSLMPDLIDRLGLSPSSNLFSDVWKEAPPERRKYFRSLSSALELRTFQTPEIWQHLDCTHAFAHRPLVEFLMAVPVEILCRPGEPRRLMRSALSDLWPAKVRMRRSKGMFSLPWQDALRPLATIVLKAGELQLVERGFLERAGVLSRLQRLSAGLDCNQDQLRKILVLELWLRSYRDHNSLPRTFAGCQNL